MPDRAHMNDEILDFSKQEPRYTPSGKARQPTRRSYPNERIFQQRKKWWMEQGFGEDAAKWAASWRLGEPRKLRGVETESERKAIENAIRVAVRRKAIVERTVRSTGQSREEVIKQLDKQLRSKDKYKKAAWGLRGVEEDTSIYSPTIEPNIFLDVS